MAREPRTQSARAERAADVDIETGGEVEPSSPANGDMLRTVECDDERVGAGVGWHTAKLQWVWSHCQAKPVIQISALPAVRSAAPITSA